MVDSLLEASDGYIYAGTGNHLTDNGDVFRTNDGGSTWTNTSDLNGPHYVYSLVEASDWYIYAGTHPTGDTIYRTNDGGVTWTNTPDIGGATVVRTLLETRDGYLFAGTGTDNGDVIKSSEPICTDNESFCADGLDNDCDRLVDTADPDCGGGTCTGTAEASVLTTRRLYGPSQLGKHLAYFVLPLGAIMVLRLWRRKK